MSSYPTPAYRRTALVPGILAGIVLVAGAAFVGTDGFVWVRYAVSILALIVAVYAVQAGRRLWLVGLVPIALAWNPVVPLRIDGPVWIGAHAVAAAMMIAAGITIRIPNPEDRNSSPR